MLINPSIPCAQSGARGFVEFDKREAILEWVLLRWRRLFAKGHAVIFMD